MCDMREIVAVIVNTARLRNNSRARETSLGQAFFFPVSMANSSSISKKPNGSQAWAS